MYIFAITYDNGEPSLPPDGIFQTLVEKLLAVHRMSTISIGMLVRSPKQGLVPVGSESLSPHQ